MIETASCIWQVTSSGAWGGGESVPVSLHRAFGRRGIRSKLFCSRESAIATRQGHGSGIKALPFSGVLDGKTRRALAGEMKTDNPDVILCHFSRDLFVLRRLLRRRGKTRLILVKHVGPGKPKKDLFHRWVYRRVHAILGVSAYIARRCRETYPIDAGRVFVWHPGVDEELFRFRPDKRSPIRRTLGLNDNDVLIGYVARLTPGKGHRDLIAAFSSLAGWQDNVYLVLLGAASPEEKHVAEELNGQMRASSVRERVILPGFVENVSDWLCACDIFVNPSPREAFGLNTIEAMAAGCPVIGTTGGGTPEIITDRENGLLVEPHNPDQLAAALTRLIDDTAWRRRLGRAARTAVETRFTHDKSVDRLLELAR